MTSFYIPHHPGPIFNRTIYILIVRTCTIKLQLACLCEINVDSDAKTLLKKVCSHFRLAIKKKKKNRTDDPKQMKQPMSDKAHLDLPVEVAS